MKIQDAAVILALVGGAYWAGGRGETSELESLVIQLEESIEQRLVAETNELARKRGIRWDETELTFAAPVAAYSDVPIGMAWHFRVWENASIYHSWGQIVRDQSVRAVFKPVQQHPAQGIRTLRRGMFWFVAVDPVGNRIAREIWAKRNRASGVPEPELILDTPTARAALVRFEVNDVWRARGDRSGQAQAIIDQWEQWIKTRGSK